MEYLTGRSLVSRIADWRDVYVNLLSYDHFGYILNYTNLTLVQVLFETRDLLSCTTEVSVSDLISGMSEHGCTLEVLEYVFSRVEPTYGGNLPIARAIEDNNPLMIKFLLQHPEVCLRLEDVLDLAASPHSLCSITILLEDDRCNKIDREDLLISAIEYENRELALYLLSLPWIDPSAKDNSAIRSAARMGDPEIVRALLSCPTVDCTANNNHALRNALAEGHAEVLQLLLSDPRFLEEYVTYLDDEFVQAVESNRAEVVRVLLEDGRFNPSNLCFSDVCKNGTLEMFLVLYADERVDWYMDENAALRTARKFGRSSMVELLLKDERVQAEEQRINKRRALLGY